MVDIAESIHELKGEIADAERLIERNKGKISHLQDMCDHKWVFVSQHNNCHAEMWNVRYACSVCEQRRVDTHRPPVCEIHNDVDLVRADEGEAKEIIAEIKDWGYSNPPMAYKCPQCSRIHILHYIGD